MITRENSINPKIVFQDNYLYLGVSDIGADRIHPTWAGSRKLAAGWFDAIKRVLGR